MNRALVVTIVLCLIPLACAATPPASTQAAASSPGKGAAAWPDPVSETTGLSTATGTIHGTLLVPTRSRTIPVALIISGSGPTDRDGNSPLLAGQNNSLRMLAQTLATSGIASLRYDKRGVAASAASGLSEADLRFDHYVMITGMNHILKTVDEDPGRQVASYSDPALPLNPALAHDLVAFIEKTAH